MLLVVLCVNLFISCQKQPAPDLFTPELLTSRAEQSDEELIRIGEDARRTLPIFFRYLTRPEAGMDNFYVKYPFKADEDSGLAMEQVWLTGIHFKNGEYYGILTNTPLHLDEIKKGDTVTFDIDEVTDWMYVLDGKIAGGRSIKYLLEKIPESRRGDDQRKILQMFD